MRIAVQFEKISVSSIFLIFIMISLIVTPARAENTLTLTFYDSVDWSEPLKEPIFIEDNYYDIVVKVEGEDKFEKDVIITISAYDQTFITSDEQPYISIKTPSYEDYSEFLITAEKEGYGTVETLIQVSKGYLDISTDRDIVGENENFAVKIKDQNENPISDVYVWLDGYEDLYTTTNQQGVAYLKTPEVDEDKNIAILAQKDGYYTNPFNIPIIDTPSPFPQLSEFIPILFAIGLVIFSMIFVKFRNKNKDKKFRSNSNYLEKEKINSNRINKDLISNNKFTKSSPVPDVGNDYKIADKGPRVEEIRIHSTDDKKMTQKISETEDNQKTLQSHDKNQYEWFKGTDYMKYKIDSMTGEIDEKKADKWFEGVDSIKEKVDKKLKKKNNKED